MNMAGRVKVAAIRALHAHLETILADYDARNSGETDGEDGAGSGLGAKTLEENDQPVKQDDPAEFPGKPANPVTNGNQLVGAKDSALSLDKRSKGLKHIPNTPGVQGLRTIPGWDRVK
jgi:hypothetical protein